MMMPEMILPYDLTFTPLVAGFMEETAACFGASEAEQKRSRLCGEEAFGLIMAGVPASGLSERFHLRCSSDGNTLIFQFSNHGRPMSIRHIPAFDVDDPDHTAEGLQLELLQNLCENIQFRNLGANGWELVLGIKLGQLKLPPALEPQKPARKNILDEDIRVRKADKSDVEGIINLVYNTYRYTYVKSLFYDPLSLAEAIETGKVLSVIATASSGEVVGHNAILVESQLLGEVGMAMVAPDYRKTGTFIRLLHATMQLLEKELPGMLLFAKAVTSHTHSQAFLQGFITTHFQLSVHPRAAFIGMKEYHNTRESLLYAVAPSNGFLDMGTIGVPGEHLEMVRQVFDIESVRAQIVAHHGRLSGSDSIIVSTAEFTKQWAQLHVSQAGMDLERQLKKQCHQLQQEGVVTIELSYPASAVFPSNMDKMLTASQFFFCGLKPCADGDWMVVYTNLTHQKFDFDALQLFSPNHQSLLEYIKKCHTRLFEVK